MNRKRNDASSRLVDERTAFWRGSTYKEPTWVSVAWIVGPLLMAGIAIYLVFG